MAPSSGFAVGTGMRAEDPETSPRQPWARGKHDDPLRAPSAAGLSWASRGSPRADRPRAARPPLKSMIHYSMHGTVIPEFDVYPARGTGIYPVTKNEARCAAGLAPARTLGETSHVGTSDSATRPRNRVPHARAHAWTHHPAGEPLRPRRVHQALRVPRPLRLRRPSSASTDGARLAPTLGHRHGDRDVRRVGPLRGDDRPSRCAADRRRRVDAS